MIDTREIATAKIVMLGGNGGGGGTSNYNQLTNKPSINGVTLQGNKTSADLNISGMPENPLATSHGGTGNADGYIRTGAQTGSTIGNRATAEGYQVVASGRYSHAGGLNNYAEYEAQMVCGKYNDNKSATLFEVGNGTVSTQTGIQRSNAFEVYSDGKVSFDNGATKYQLTSYNGDFGFYDASGTFHTFSGGSGGDSYAGLGIGKMTSFTNDVIDTDVDLHRAPVEGDRLLVYISESVSNPSSLKTYNNGVAVTTNITFGQTYPVGLAIFRYTPLGWQCLQTIAYSAGTGISITGTTISNSAPQLGMNIGYGEVTSVTDGNIGSFNGNADYLDIDFKVNASPYNGGYTLYLAMGGSTVIMKYATLKDRYGSAYDKDIQRGTILHCLSKVSGIGTEQAPIVVKVIDENVIANPTGTPNYNLKKIKVGSYIYDALGINPYEAYSISNGGITIHTADPNTYDGQIIAVNTESHSGTTTSAWYLNLVGNGSSYPIAMTNADGTDFKDALSENELLFVYVDTHNPQKAILLKTAGASGGGATSLASLSDTNILSPQEGQVLTYDGLKWTNQPVEPKVVYGFHIDGAESNPSNKISYLEDAIGKSYAHMDYSRKVFNYGSWENAFFMPKPCMLKQDGTVDYYLDPNDYSKKEDGTASDIANTSYNGNAMMEWPKIYLKIIPNSDNTSANVYISNRYDVGYTAWPYIDSNGEEKEHFYTAIYNSKVINNVARSLSGQNNTMNKQLMATDRTMIKANNASGQSHWDMGNYSEKVLIAMLAMLISKTTDSQTAFGKGLSTNGTEALNNGFTTGIHNTKGLFYGTNSGTASNYANAVKIFGMENYYAFNSERVLGLIVDGGVIKTKLCYGQSDGSTADDYSFDATGYIAGESLSTLGDGEGWCNSLLFNENGFMPYRKSTLTASASTYYCDYHWFSSLSNRVPLIGGYSGRDSGCGVFCWGVNQSASDTDWDFSARIVCI